MRRNKNQLDGKLSFEDIILVQTVSKYFHAVWLKQRTQWIHRNIRLLQESIEWNAQEGNKTHNTDTKISLQLFGQLVSIVLSKMSHKGEAELAQVKWSLQRSLRTFRANRSQWKCIFWQFSVPSPAIALWGLFLPLYLLWVLLSTICFFPFILISVYLRRKQHLLC